MKLNSTVALTLLLLMMMVGAGSVSAFKGYTLGRESLKGVTQPDVSPTKKLTSKQSGNQTKEPVFISERAILVRVYDHINAKSKTKDTEADLKEAKQQQKQEQKDSFIKSPDVATENKKASDNFPLQGQDQGVIMEVLNATQEGGSLVLDVNLKNDSKKAVRFLYSFLDVRDQQGRALSAITDGLPGELPGNGEKYPGTVRIPTALLDEAKNLSLTLTDYPDQKLKLEVKDIPISSETETRENSEDTEAIETPETP